MTQDKPLAAQGIRTAQTHMHFSGRSRAAFVIWALCQEATTALLTQSITLAWWLALQIQQPPCTHLPGLQPRVLPILEPCQAQMRVRRLRSMITVRLWAAPADMQRCGPAVAFRTWARWAAL